MPTRNVVLTQHQSELIDRLVSSGHYQNASEVLREGLRLIERRDEMERERRQALHAAVQIGIDDIESGHYRAFSRHEELRGHLDALAAQALGADRDV